MVTIIGSYSVTPKEETPNGVLWLAENDQVPRWSHQSILYIYKPKHSESEDDFNVFVERMRESLSHILVPYYPLAGRLNWIQGGRLKLDCNAKGAMLLEAQSNKSMAEYGDFSPSQPIKELIPTVDYSRPIEELPLLLAQITRFQQLQEGIAIGIAWSHPICDGLAAIHFINSWAKVTRGNKLEANEIPILYRTLLKPSHPLSQPRFDHREYKPLPLILGRSDTIEEQKKKTSFVQLKLTSMQVQKLKKNANNNDFQSEKPYTRFEAIGAHLWRCACKARELHKNQPTVFKTVVDIRKKMNPPLPQNYFGNALAGTVSPTCYVGEIVAKPLSYAAKNIREAVKMINDEYIRSQIDFYAGEEHMDRIRVPYLEKGEHRADILFSGNPNLRVTSWMGMPVYEADFGWGRLVHFGQGALSPFDVGFVALSPDMDGSILVFMHFQEAHMQNFIKFFWEDI
ncbi:hypothetical protein HN51_027351 [Arachis hypogaea]|uniref:Spermidine hydroxycinnamoyl transferase n=1 Tax=Arachis hypogaea TaxID=3818 RepID=A0A445BNF2_ARAHY|nr:spermidine hydroxycinnamoyl transferase isoform X1 [Arachis hypogaea]QHO33683.1 Spermidine hydroxycinnamoyl transferase [Arachis hypogaea]RYR40210.1 hypothetical protein Ahy_A09g045924 [Arachis hypogaea]